MTINLATRTALGSLGSTRNSADSTSYIACILYATAGQPTRSVCQAQDASGTFVSCTSTDPAVRDAVASISGDSYLYFQWSNAGLCTYVVVENASTMEPKH